MYPVLMSIQIHAGGRDFFFIKTVPYGAFLVYKYVIINQKINNFKANFAQC